MNRRFNDLGSFARYCAKLSAEADAKLAVGMLAIAKNTKHSIQDVMGNPQLLAPNAASTIAQKGKNAPLIDTGALRDSLEAKSDGFESGVGTPDPKMLWHEYGMGRNYPARPAMYVGTHEASAENKEIFRLVAHSVLGDTLAANTLAAKVRKIE